MRSRAVHGLCRGEIPIISKPVSLFVFAHQDDEVAALSRIEFELERGCDVHCVFLTDGASRVASSIRDSESLAVLTSIGVPGAQIHHIGSALPIGDGKLVHDLDRALEHLDRAMREVPVTSVYLLAWEGGHQDHDASHLVGLAFASARGLLDRTYELLLYRGAARGLLFRVFSPARSASWQRRRLRLRDGIRYALLVRHYHSQRSSWAGLFAETFFKLALLRRELVRPAEVARVRSRPHEGPLLYERRFGVPHADFMRAALPFIDRHFPMARSGRR